MFSVIRYYHASPGPSQLADLPKLAENLLVQHQVHKTCNQVRHAKMYGRQDDHVRHICSRLRDQQDAPHQRRRPVEDSCARNRVAASLRAAGLAPEVVQALGLQTPD